MGGTDQGSEWMLITVRLKDEHPTLTQAANVMGIPVSELDEGFGVIVVDRQQKLFALQVRERALAHIKGREDGIVKGPFSNARIEPLK